MFATLQMKSTPEVEPVMDDAIADRLHHRWTELLEGAMRCLARWRPCMEALALWMSDMPTFYRLYTKLSTALERCQQTLADVLERGLHRSQCEVIEHLVDDVCMHAATLDTFLRHESARARDLAS